MSSRFFIQDRYVFVELGEEIRLIGDFFELLRLCRIDFDLKNVLSTDFEIEKVIRLVPETDLCRVWVSDDNLCAFISIYPIFTPNLTVDDILDKLAQIQVNTGIDLELIAAVVKEAQPVEELVIARGTAPIPGSPQIIVNHFNPIEKIEFKVDEDGNVDFKNLDNIINIKKGTVLATRTREHQPEPGLDVFGNIIEPPPLVNEKFEVGRGIIVVDDEAVAYMDGYLELDDRGRLSINNTMIVNGDVAYSTGNLNVDGNIIIKGDILPGFCVRASRNIDILGSAEDALIQAGGDINIRGSAVGRKGCKIEASGDISVNYAQNSTLHSEGSIHVKKYVYNSRLISGDMIYLNSREGVVLGDANVIRAKNAVYVKTILQDKPMDICVTGFSTAEYSEVLDKVEDESAQKIQLMRLIGSKKADLTAASSESRNNSEILELLKLEQSLGEELGVLNRLKKRLTYIINRIPQPGIVEIEKSSCTKLTITIGTRSLSTSPFAARIKFISDDEMQRLVMK